MVPPGTGVCRPAQRRRMLEGVGIEEHLGRNVDLNLTFIAENGYPVALTDFSTKAGR